jgi:hypothetical protein
MSIFKNARRKPFWQWCSVYAGTLGQREWPSWGFGVGCFPTLPRGLCFSMSFLWWQCRVLCVWDQWRDE